MQLFYDQETIKLTRLFMKAVPVAVAPTTAAPHMYRISRLNL